VAWIFQGNPKTFDVDDYVTRYPELIYWRTNRHAKEIAVGDRAVVWRSGSSAGAVAIGVVVEAPTLGNKVKHPEALGIDVRGAKESDPEGLQTGIHLEEVRLTSEEGFLPRMAVKRNPALAQATIITMSSGTVFPLSQSQTAAFERLWGLSVFSLTLTESASEGERKLNAHYRRERSRALRDNKLAQVRALHGKCVCALCSVDEASKYPALFGSKIFEVHHLLPLSKAASPMRTTLEDLVVLCASCHRAVHATPAAEENYAALAVHLRSEN
jgi:EVE domain/HNH endonuclease